MMMVHQDTEKLVQPGGQNGTHADSPRLTGIRFLAAVYVFLFHYGASALDRHQFVGGRQYVDYLISRFGRIYPVYFLTLAVSLPIAIGLLKLKPALAVLFMVQSWGNAFSDNGYTWVMQAWTGSGTV